MSLYIVSEMVLLWYTAMSMFCSIGSLITSASNTVHFSSFWRLCYNGISTLPNSCILIMCTDNARSHRPFGPLAYTLNQLCAKRAWYIYTVWTLATWVKGLRVMDSSDWRLLRNATLPSFETNFYDFIKIDSLNSNAKHYVQFNAVIMLEIPTTNESKIMWVSWNCLVVNSH